MIARLALLLAAGLALAACGRPAEPAREWPAPSPALWAVGPQEAPVAWLFGTVHALPAGVRWRTPLLERALEEAGLLVVEIAELDDPDAASAAFAAASTTPGLPPVSDRVAAGDRARLLAAMERAGLEDADLSGHESWAAALILANATRRHDPALGVDRALVAGARRVEGLETYADQFARFDGLSPAGQAQLLLAVADDAFADEQDVRIDAWLTGDIPRLEALSAGRLFTDAELHEALIAARNRAWAERIARLVAAGERPLVAVGAGHMLGAGGLPALLAAQGLAVSRVQ